MEGEEWTLINDLLENQSGSRSIDNSSNRTDQSLDETLDESFSDTSSQSDLDKPNGLPDGLPDEVRTPDDNINISYLPNQSNVDIYTDPNIINNVDLAIKKNIIVENPLQNTDALEIATKDNVMVIDEVDLSKLEEGLYNPDQIIYRRTSYDLSEKESLLRHQKITTMSSLKVYDYDNDNDNNRKPNWWFNKKWVFLGAGLLVFYTAYVNSNYLINLF